MIVLALASVLLLGACREDPPDHVNGKTLFLERCQACHALERAGGGGTQGPDLDQAFAQARRDGMGARTVEGVVRQQIAHPLANSIMPADLVTGDDARDVASYIAMVAAQPGEDTGALAEVGETETQVAEAENGVLQIDADPSGQLRFVAEEAIASPGRITFRMDNPSPIQHNIALEDGAEGPVVGQGGTSEFTARLSPGTYTYVCTVPGHTEGGMVGELTVE